MLLRSSSTPILGSILSNSFSESPNNHNHSLNNLEKTTSLSPSSFLNQHNKTTPLGFRRVQSDSNLNSLTSLDHATRHVLDTILSFSMYSTNEKYVENEYDEYYEECKDAFSFEGLKSQNSGSESNVLPLFLARGLGIDRLGSGLLNAGNCDGNGGQRSELENYYRRMVDENPSNALFLSNYAQFLYQTKGDDKRAEEYYSRAILAEPGNGEILSQYAKLVWKLHKDRERASSYFEQAVLATPSNSHVLAAVAHFLWETDDDNDGGGEEGHSENYFEVTPMRDEIMA